MADSWLGRRPYPLRTDLSCVDRLVYSMRPSMSVATVKYLRPLVTPDALSHTTLEARAQSGPIAPPNAILIA